MISAFYSDPHLNHQRILRLSNRPYESIDEMNQDFVARYNERVKRDDLVLWLGDAFFGPADQAKEIIAAMNGTKFLIVGNHDKSPKTMCEVGFDFTTTEMILSMGGRKVRVNHYPYEGAGHGPEGAQDDRHAEKRPKRIKGEVLIHGHTHSDKKRKDNMIHVGVDAWDFGPVLWEEAEELVREV